MIANCSIVQAKILTSLSALTFFAALFTFLICTLTIKIYTQAHWSTIPTKMAKSEIFSCRRSRVCELWSHFNPTVEKRWQRPLPLQCLWLVVAKIIIVTAVSIPLETFASVCKKYDMLDIILIIVCLGVENMVE